MGLGSDTMKLTIDSGGEVSQVSLENQLARPSWSCFLVN